ncbi:MAG: UDP-3-O-(3-hydroxymyristoyl)glucosamine N-acyltransferase [Phycisphaerae bacterium]
MTPLTVREIARRLKAEVSGDDTRLIARVATLELAQPDALSWIGDPKYADALATTRAGAVLVPGGVVGAVGTTVIRVADPDLALCEVLGWLSPPPPQVPAGIDPSARVASDADVGGAAIGPGVLVGAGAQIGAGTQLHANVYIGAETRIGRDCVLWPNVVVRERVTIGERVIVHANATIGADGFGYLLRDGKHRKIPQIGTVEIGDDVEIGANACIDRAKSGVTRIGRGTKIDNLVQIGHNAEIGEHCMLVGQVGIAGSVTLREYVALGGQAGVVDHVEIGRGARVGAQAGVMRDVPAGHTVMGTPAEDLTRQLREVAALRRLPEMLSEWANLLKRVTKLESSANDRE